MLAYLLSTTSDKKQKAANRSAFSILLYSTGKKRARFTSFRRNRNITTDLITEGREYFPSNPFVSWKAGWEYKKHGCRCEIFWFSLKVGTNIPTYTPEFGFFFGILPFHFIRVPELPEFWSNGNRPLNCKIYRVTIFSFFHSLLLLFSNMLDLQVEVSVLPLNFFFVFPSHQVLVVGGSSADIDVFTNFGYKALSFKFSQ